MSIFKKMSLMAMTIAITIGTNLINIVLIARSLGAEDFGVFSYYIAISALLMIVLNYGYPISLPKNIAANQDNAIVIFEESLSVKIIIFLFLLFLVLSYSIILNNYILLVFFLALSLFSFSVHFNLLNRGLGVFSFETKNTLYGNVFFILLVLGVYFYCPSIINYAVAYLISRSILLLLVVRQIRCQFPKLKIFDINRSGFYKSLKENIAYTIDSMSISAFGIVDIFLVKLIFDSYILGVYQVGMKFLYGTLPLIQVIANVFIPAISKCNNPKYEKILLVISFFSSIVISLGFFVVFDYIINSLFGSSYSSVLEITPVLSLIIFLKYVSSGIGILTTTRGMQKERSKINISSLILFILLSLFLSKNTFELNAIIYGFDFNFIHKFSLDAILWSYISSILYVFFSYYIILKKEKIIGLDVYVLMVLMFLIVLIIYFYDCNFLLTIKE